MLPRTHHFIINLALTGASSWLSTFRQEILQGNDDEDVHIVPLVKWRLRAAGFTHTHVPGGYLGELGFPSAKRQCNRFMANARQEKRPARAAWWLGRACHLLGDVAVPARARRVWHLEGDPLEAWLESNLDRLGDVQIEPPSVTTTDEMIEEMARVASTFPADTTRTPWGRAAFRWFGLGQTLDESELERQAHVLIPCAVRLTKCLLASVNR